MLRPVCGYCTENALAQMTGIHPESMSDEALLRTSAHGGRHRRATIYVPAIRNGHLLRTVLVISSPNLNHAALLVGYGTIGLFVMSLHAGGRGTNILLVDRVLLHCTSQQTPRYDGAARKGICFDTYLFQYICDRFLTSIVAIGLGSSSNSRQTRFYKCSIYTQNDGRLL
jgi:hypothetical protein